MGDGMFLTAFPLLAATLTRDAVTIAGVTVASRLPWLLFSLIAGAIADRVNRRRLMVAADVVRTAMVALLSIAVITDVAHVWELYLCAFGLGIGETLHANAAQALIPVLVENDVLVKANARLTGAQVITENFAGPPLGAALFGVAAAVPFVVDTASFIAAAGLVAAIPDAPAPAVSVARPGLRADIAEGLRFLWGHRVLRRLVTILGALNFSYYATEAVLILYTFQRLHAGKGVYAVLFLAIAAGTLATQSLITPLEQRVGRIVTIKIAFWLWALPLVGLVFTTRPAVAIVCFFGLGCGDGLWRVLTVTLRQVLTPNHLMGRVNSAYRMVAQGVIPLGAGFGGALAKLFGIRAPFVAAAVVFVAIAVFADKLLAPLRAEVGYSEGE
jgi:MFS family permease